MVAQGLTNREIAAKLFISERTADGHLEHIREKLGVGTRAQVAAWVVRQAATPIAAPALPARTVSSRRALLAHPRAWLAATLVLAVLAAGVGVLRLTAPPPPIVRTVAGSQCAKQVYPGGCYGGDNQRALVAQLARPTSVAVDSQDRLHLLTSIKGVLEVWRIDANGLMRSVVSVGPSSITITQFAPNLPVGGLAITKEGVLFIADRPGNRVMRYDGQTSTYAGTGDALGDGGAATSAQLSWPIGLALDKHENLYIADTGNNRIRRVDRAKGTIETVAGGAGAFEGNSGDDGMAKDALLSFPFDVAVAADGTIVFSDTGNHRLRAVTPDGRIYAVAGTGRWGLLGDGSQASDAEFDGPEGLTLDSQGNLFIADTENQRVREIPRLFGSG